MLASLVSFVVIPPQPRDTLFPYTTLFRSGSAEMSSVLLATGEATAATKAAAGTTVPISDNDRREIRAALNDPKRGMRSEERRVGKESRTLAARDRESSVKSKQRSQAIYGS